MKIIQVIFCFIFCIEYSQFAFGQERENCKAYLHKDTLTLENGVVFEHFLWNKGNLIRLAFGDVVSGQSVVAPDNQPFFNTGEKGLLTSGEGILKVSNQPATSVTPAYVKAEVICSIGKMQVLRVFRLYPGCPAIACDLYLKGQMKGSTETLVNAGDLKNIENDAAKHQGESMVAVTDKVRLSGNHWKARSVEFFDVTDRNNTLVQTYDRILYRQECQLRGNLLFLENILSGKRLFLLKEAPASSVQLYYPGYDFTVKQGEAKVTGLGVADSDLSGSSWTKAYGTVMGLSLTNDETGILSSLREYQQSVRTHLPGRDDMILMNTWGDRGQDSKVNEAFCLNELEAAAKLGITHFQLDDGWQTGRSSNSALPGGSLNNIWTNPDYWKPNPAKFPNGLKPIVKRGKELDIEICLWFNPSHENSNANWEKDADVLIGLYNSYGIHTFKIDGVNLPDKTSEVNFRKMLDKVVEATRGQVVFNLDVTAGRRGGYNFFNEYGNIFLENRYTDWQNYYPYWTLRNLWMLSRYIPPQNLQTEFLNKWRNADKYGEDPLAPGNYSFDYLFAITMVAQPLAWFEGSGLPREAFSVAESINKYKQVMNDLHSGIILPVGDEPSGKSWTGFQSQKSGSDEGYVLIFRELNDSKTGKFDLPLLSSGSYHFERIMGCGKSFRAACKES
ncbi:MAG: alpha-galactosidase, partial [Bacteroidota bacterium]|nr:alpha-galactosidase [Bacteroidota bacterium]